MFHLQALHFRPGEGPREYPFTLALLEHLDNLEFSAPLTIFVGENGSGKSTLLEGIAALVKLPAIGGRPLLKDPSLRHAHSLAKSLRPKWQRPIKRGFFLRAEDFFGFVRGMEEMRLDLREELATAERQARERGASDYGIAQSKTPWAGQLAGLEDRYGADLDAASHGESFLQLLQARVIDQGLYLLDEPEAALSPMRQLALMAFFKDRIEQGRCQFIIASHSPILLAFPGAQLLHFGTSGIHPIEYEDLEHVRFTRDFLNAPEAFLRFL